MIKIKTYLTHLFLAIVVAILFFMLICDFAKSGTVRTVYLDDTRIENIYLKLGQTTVLNFLEKSNKVAIGNKNHFNVEYVGNDVTVQPLRMVMDSNFFVYGDYHRYGFILKVINDPNYDDLVKVRWDEKEIDVKSEKSEKSEKVAKSGITIMAATPPPKPIPALSPMPTQLSVPVPVLSMPTPAPVPATAETGLEVTLQKVISLQSKQFILVDLMITNLKDVVINLKDLKIVILARGGSPKAILKEVVFEQDQLSKANDITRARLILFPNGDDEITLEITYETTLFATFKRTIVIKKGGSYKN
ncbi:MAG: TrbG/VirB9 family P-type conjugative transfer protein [Oligoflexia bacterium]|nr:TrbG/VirB9 family P-type conjugative transfer protein [Oligoflexia bacterium]